MTVINYQTLSLCLGLVSLISIFVFWSLWRINTDVPGPQFWFASALLVGVGFVVVLLTPVVGLGTVVALNNITSLGGPLLGLEGILRFRRLGNARQRRPFLMVAWVLIIVLAIVNRDDAVRRYLFHDVLVVCIFLVCAWALVWRVRGRALAIQGVSAAAFVLVSMAFARRWFLAWEAEPGASLAQHPWMTTLFLCLFVQTVVWVETMNLAVNQWVQDRLLALAMSDELTKLPNRRAFVAATTTTLSRAQRRGGHFGLSLVDLDGFKPINDQYGHDVGDALLQLIGQRAHSTLRGNDMVGRIGGDEFVVLVDDCPDSQTLRHTLDRFQQMVEAPCVLQNPGQVPLSLSPRISVGEAFFPDDGETLEVLMRVADQRMYQHKQQRKAHTQPGSGSAVL